ncbi:glycosyltransferase family 4 protein [Patescibacteria group bacterium]|nr:glycosyltransferase family 4 protein [Patescibacteria group bacterium]
MKIVFLQDDFPPTSFGGAGISTYELAIGMKKAGHEVFVITTCRKKSEAGELDYHGIKVFKIANDYPARWRAYLSLYNPPVVRGVEELLKKIRPDVVHANNIHFYLSYRCLKVARQYAKAVVFTARDAMSFNFGKLQTKQYLENFDSYTTWLDHLRQAKKRWNPFRNFFIKRYLKYADELFAVSNALKEALSQNGIKNVEVIHTGADVDLWHVNEEEAARFRKRHNVENKKVILFGGRLSEAKGGTKALKAMLEIVKDVPEVVLLVAGKIDRYADYMKKEAGKLGIEDRLIFTGWIEREEIKSAYAVADIVLVPSICFDAFPRIVLEGMASGKPVVGTCYGGAPEIVVDGVTGYIVNPLHQEEIAEKILDLLKNPKKAEKFGQAGYERVKTHFNLEDKVAEYIAVYKVLLEKKNGKSG